MNDNMREYHDACIKELYRLLDIDSNDGEYRFKWVSLELGKLLREVKTLREENKKLRRLLGEDDTEEKIPETLEEALSMIESELAQEDRKVIAESSPSEFHFSVGMGLRNRWKLWTGSSLSLWFNKAGIKHPDDMSAIILTALKHRVVGTPYDMEKDVKFYQEYWKNSGNETHQTRWKCRRCGEVVDMEKFKCGCTESPSPWEPMP